MEFLKKFEMFNRKLCLSVEWVGLFAFMLMMTVTTVDVLGTKVFLTPLPGALDIMMVAQLIAISFAIASTLFFGGHIQVEFFAMLFPKNIQTLIEIVVSLLGLVLFVLISWNLFKYGYDLKECGEVSPTIRLPLYPFAIAAALACIPACLIYLHKIFKTLHEVIKK